MCKGAPRREAILTDLQENPYILWSKTKKYPVFRHLGTKKPYDFSHQICQDFLPSKCSLRDATCNPFEALILFPPPPLSLSLSPRHKGYISQLYHYYLVASLINKTFLSLSRRRQRVYTMLCNLLYTLQTFHVWLNFGRSMSKYCPILLLFLRFTA